MFFTKWVIWWKIYLKPWMYTFFRNLFFETLRGFRHRQKCPYMCIKLLNFYKFPENFTFGCIFHFNDYVSSTSFIYNMFWNKTILKTKFCRSNYFVHEKRKTREEHNKSDGITDVNIFKCCKSVVSVWIIIKPQHNVY